MVTKHRIKQALIQPVRASELFGRLKKIAEAEERSLSYIVLKALREWLAAKEARQ